MRISTNGAYQRGLSLMQQLQSALDRTQRQISSGRRLLTPSDDPVASARSLDLKESVARLGQFERNGNVARNRLSFEDSALNSINNVLQRVRELAVQANNATQSNESRGLIAIEMRAQLDSLLQLANQPNGDSGFLFSGTMDETQPVSRNGAGFVFNGNQGQRMIQIGDNRQVADGDSGSEVFFRVRNGNGTFATSAAATNTGTGVAGAGSVSDQTQYDRDQYTIRFIDAATYEVVDSAAAIVASGTFQSGQAIAFRGIQVNIDGSPAAADEFNVSPSTFNNVFSMVSDLASAVELSVNDGPSRAAMNNGINAGLLAMDQAIGNIIDTRTRVGSRLAAIENQEDANTSTVLTLREAIAQLEDLDYAEAISRLSLEATTLEAAQQTFIRTQGLSLFNYF